jgi:MHS family proline/betaine transporter-like MFS transporter
MLKKMSIITSLKSKILMSGMVGNMLESFDVMICAYLATYISKSFFAPASQKSGLLYIFTIFLIGYLSRPLGSLLIGAYSDQVGRKKVLIYSILFTGFFTALIGLIPSYATIGFASTVLFISLRILQNMFIGGEYISSISYLIESADNGKRGYYGSWVSVGLNSGTLLASLAVYFIIKEINIGNIPEWSWRIVFVCSIIGTLLGLWIRSSLPESLGYILNNSSPMTRKRLDIVKSAIALINQNRKKCLALISIAWFGVGETATVFVYSPIHIYTINKLSQQDALEINSISLILLILLIPLFGNLYDYFNKIRILIGVTFFFMLISPLYFYYLSYGNYVNLLLIKLLISIPSACYYSLATVLITESFPINIRCTSLALVYQSTVALAGGLTPLALIWMMNSGVTAPFAGIYQAMLMSTTALACILGLVYLKNSNKPNISVININNPLKESLSTNTL